MGWNHRVVRKKYEQKIGDEVRVEWYYSIKEVYYDSDGKAVACTLDDPGVGGETIEGLLGMYVQMKSAFEQPILDYDLIPDPTRNKQDEISKAFLEDIEITEEDTEEMKKFDEEWSKEDSDNYWKEQEAIRIAKEEEYQEHIKDIVPKRGWNHDFKMSDFYKGI
jgi:hypothetical protein